MIFDLLKPEKESFCYCSNSSYSVLICVALINMLLMGTIYHIYYQNIYKYMYACLHEVTPTIHSNKIFGKGVDP